MSLETKDIEMKVLIDKEYKRQIDHLELIASENYVSKEVLEAQGSILTNKYAEGYPNKRYYGGCEVVDEIEALTIKRACKLFGCKYANVQAHSGTQANMAVYKALLNIGDTVMGMDLSSGGHLSHGSSVNFSGKEYNFIPYGLNKKTELIDYDEVLNIALKCKPKLIVCGASSYPRFIDFKKFRDIANEVNAILMCDMAHIAGLVAGGTHQNPLFYCDVVTSTTHKTLRGPRGGLILTNNEEIIKKINKTIFPGVQGGPLMHVIAAKGVMFKEDASPDFSIYVRKVIENAKAMADEFMRLGYHVISNGTDNHLLLVDIVSKSNITGKEAETLLDKAHITVNKNSIPFDPLPHNTTSGIRIGTPAITTRGFRKEECKEIVRLIDRVLTNPSDENIEIVKNEVLKILEKYPLNY